jgi:hypothetical protein
MSLHRHAAILTGTIATDDYEHVAGHAGQARHWLVSDSAAGSDAPSPVDLAKHQVFHHWKEDGPRPLDGIKVIIAGSAGDGFVRRMTKRGIQVLLTGERDAAQAFAAELNGGVAARPCLPSSSSVVRVVRPVLPARRRAKSALRCGERARASSVSTINPRRHRAERGLKYHKPHRSRNPGLNGLGATCRVARADC